MIVGVGTDLVDIARLGAGARAHPTLRDRLFTPAEATLPVESLAARFAAKEALAKALGAPGGLSWQDAEVVVEDGVARFALHGASRTRSGRWARSACTCRCPTTVAWRSRSSSWSLAAR